MTDEQVKMIGEVFYNQFKMIEAESINKKSQESFTMNYDSMQFFEKPLNENEIQSILNEIKNKNSLTISANKIELNCNLTTFESDFLKRDKYYYIEFNKIISSNKLNLETIKQDQSSNEEVSIKFRWKNEVVNLDENAKIILDIYFLSGTDFIILNKEELGKEFELANKKYLLLDIIDNFIVVKPIELGRRERLLSLVNFENNLMAYKNKTSEFYLTEGSKQNPNYKQHHNYSSNALAQSKFYYETYKEDSKISKDKFLAKVDHELINSMQDEIVQFIFNTESIGDKFILYRPIYTKRTIEIEK